jgi:hypothetical protein
MTQRSFLYFRFEEFASSDILDATPLPELEKRLNGGNILEETLAALPALAEKGACKALVGRFTSVTDVAHSHSQGRKVL